ncbi:MAG TPA: sigma-70 family RNA polymerase sigma factor [Kofleriaceae bacterium]
MADFEHLLETHAGIVGKIARSYARTPDERRDLSQEIVTQLWRAFPRFDATRGKFSTWMYRIALNVAISHLRSARVFEPLDVDLPGEAHDDRIPDLYAVIHTLDPMNRALVVLYLEDRSYADIGEVLGISEANVATKLSRLKGQLRAQLKGA